MLQKAAAEQTPNATATILFNLIQVNDFNHKIELAKTLRLYFPAPIEPLDAEKLLGVRKPGRSEQIKLTTQDELTQEKFSEYCSQVEYLHAIANIELLSVEITALGLIRFGSNDQKFIRKQLMTIAEKASHFQMLSDRLQDFGMVFGVLPLNHSIWEYAWQCQTSFEQQVLVACYLEAKRLDLSPLFLKKMIKAGDEKTTRIMKIILAEEVNHVKNGMKFLKQEAVGFGKDPDKLFWEIINKVVPHGSKTAIPINEEYRRLAGFSQEQIKHLKTGA